MDKIEKNLEKENNMDKIEKNFEKEDNFETININNNEIYNIIKYSNKMCKSF
eukprot:jgi/Orpsp1_1/1182511/evm.model.c7180000081577.1